MPSAEESVHAGLCRAMGHLIPSCQAIHIHLDNITWGYITQYAWGKLRENNAAHMASYLFALQAAETQTR